MATKSIGFVAELAGDAQVRSVDGVIRVLSIGDRIYDGDVLTTGLNTHIVLEFYNGQRFQVGESTNMLLDESVFAGLIAYPDDRADQLAELQNLIVEGIDLAELEATAAGDPASSANALHQASVYSRDGDQGVVETRATPFDTGAPNPVNQIQPEDDSAAAAQSSSPTSNNSPVGRSNTAPVAVDDSITAIENTVYVSTVDLDFNDTDVDGDALTVVAGTFTTTQGGSITIATDGSYTYTPALNFNGADSVDYTVSDGNLVAVGTLTINVSAINNAPDAVNDVGALDGVEDSTTGSLNATMLANDSDLDGDTINIIEINGTPLTGLAQSIGVVNGTVNIDAVGNITFSASANYYGPVSFDYTLSDGTLSDTATVDGVISPVNDAPVAIDDAITATEDTPFNSAIELDANDTDLDGDALTVVAGTFATTQGGSITIATDGSYTYTPAANFNGTDSVDYTVTDGSLTDVGTLNITVNPVNDAPVAVDDAITATEDTPFNSVIELDANDTDLDGDTLSVVAGTFATVQGGSITIATDGSYTYTPAANFNGSDSVDYTVTDGSSDRCRYTQHHG